MKVFDRLDNSLELPEHERMVFESVRRLSEEVIKPRAARYDETGEFPWDNVRDINAAGLNTMFIPAAYGGTELSYRAYLACCREITKGLRFHGHHLGDEFPCGEPIS